MNSQKRYESGFTIVEIIAVLLLLSIIAATVMGRSISTENIDLTAQTDRVRNHFRYAQSMAMKHGDAVWGFRCFGLDPLEYWVFRLEHPVADPMNELNLPANQVMLPGETDLRVNLTSRGVSMTPFVIFFDRFGRPHLFYDESFQVLLPNPQKITLSPTTGAPPQRDLWIIPETGLIR